MSTLLHPFHRPKNKNKLLVKTSFGLWTSYMTLDWFPYTLPVPPQFTQFPLPLHMEHLTLPDSESVLPCVGCGFVDFPSPVPPHVLHMPVPPQTRQVSLSSDILPPDARSQSYFSTCGSFYSHFNEFRILPAILNMGKDNSNCSAPVG